MKVNILITLAMLLLFISACGTQAITTEPPPLPTSTPLPTNTPAPTATATVPPSPTPIPPTPTPEFEQFYTEEFEKGLKYWPSFLVSGSPYFGASILKEPEENFIVSAEVEDGFFKFNIDHKLHGWGAVYAIYDPFDYENVRIDARVENQGTNNNNISLICHYSADTGWYEFNIANNGLYWIFFAKLRPEDGVISYGLIEEGGSNKIKQGLDTNEYTAICQGNTLTLYINDNLTKEVKDDRLTSGKVGVSVTGFSQIAKVNFDWVKISQP